MDRRRLLMVGQLPMAGCSAGLAVNADLGTSLWPLFVLPALAAGFGALNDARRTAIVPNLVRRSELAGVNAIFHALFQFGLVTGPAVAGLLLAGAEAVAADFGDTVSVVSRGWRASRWRCCWPACCPVSAISGRRRSARACGG